MLSPDNLSVQLYTVRDRLSADPDAVLADLAEAGLTKVEPYGLVDFRDALAEGLPKHGLTAPSTHAALFDADLDRTFDVAAELGVQTVVAPVSDRTAWGDADQIAAIAEGLNAAATVGADRGIKVGYHNHWWELEHDFDGRTGLDVLASHLSDDVVLEVDTYWALVGGADVSALLERLGDRVFALHLKDGDGTRDNKNQVAAGQGQVPILDFVAACPSMQLGVIELDDSRGDLTQAVRDSFAYLNGK